MLPNLETAKEVVKDNETVVKCFSCKNDLYSILKANGIATIYSTKNLITDKMEAIKYNSNKCLVCGNEWVLNGGENCEMLTNRGEIVFPMKLFCDMKL